MVSNRAARMRERTRLPTQLDKPHELMACQITFQDRWVQLNNAQFSRLIDWAIVVAEQTATDAEHAFVERMQRLRDECFWPGRGIDVEDDFPEVTELKFWCRVFFDASRAIFDRTLGVHEHSFWQAQAIHQMYASGLLFEYAVRNTEPGWSADTIDRREFHEIVNGPA